ncbi:MAG: M14 family zinc carboxypeptidase, partial [Bryobacteraceae bacterium]
MFYASCAVRAWFALTLAAFVARGAEPKSVTPPEKFFGFQLGSDRKIARWARIVEYYRLLEREAAGKLKVVEMGPSTEGRPFLLVIVTAPENMERLERLRQVNLRLSDPRGLSEQEAAELVAEGRAVICQSMSLHATEIGGTQMAPELAYELVARDDAATRRILENVIFLLIPCFNPDGAEMVADWYEKTLGTEYEGSNLPWLYHQYAGHDNNRDAFQLNLVESRYAARILFREWIPQAYVDHHHMGSYGPRLYVPPYTEPIRPHADPLVWREMSWYGAHIAYKEEEAGLSGIINMAEYSGWGHFGFHWIAPFHNIAGMLTESASARLATPIYIHPDQLRGGARGFPAYAPQTTFPNPWPGGWWRLRDIVERQKVAAWAVLDLAARNRETVLWNAFYKAKRQTERGAQGKPKAYLVPPAQHDPLTALKMINNLLAQGIEVHRARSGFTLPSGMSYPAGTFVVSLAQPKMGLIRYLLGRTFYPDNEWTRARDGTPIRPYDLATDTMFEFMGVRVDPCDDPVRVELEKVTSELKPQGAAPPGASAYALDGRLNDSFRATNLLLDRGAAVRRLHRAWRDRRPGDFIVSGPAAALAEVARATGVDFIPLEQDPADAARPVERLRTGLYRRYSGGNMDEGWTRLLLEQFGFPYKSVMDAEIKKGGLRQDYDVFLLPDDSTARITGERRERQGEAPPPVEEEYPPEYRSGIGEEGVKALREFVEQGGTLITLGDASMFPVEKLGLRLRNLAAGKSSKEFWCPGSTLRVRFDPAHPLAYGMPEEGLAL